jgi:hypothetical protein
LGGKKSSNGGFASLNIGKDGRTGRERASIYGAIGGRKSRRTKYSNGYISRNEKSRREWEESLTSK